MKKKDITTIVIIIFLSAVISVVLSKAFISAPKNRQAKVEVVEAINSSFPEPDKKYFNSNSVNPTQLIIIGGNANIKPFDIK